MQYGRGWSCQDYVRVRKTGCDLSGRASPLRVGVVGRAVQTRPITNGRPAVHGRLWQVCKVCDADVLMSEACAERGQACGGSLSEGGRILCGASTEILTVVLYACDNAVRTWRVRTCSAERGYAGKSSA